MARRWRGTSALFYARTLDPEGWALTTAPAIAGMVMKMNGLWSARVPNISIIAIARPPKAH